MSWSLVVVTDTDGTPLGELRNPDERKISYRLRGATTTSFQIPLREPLADALLDGDVLVKMYESDPLFAQLFGQRDQLRFHGEVVDTEEVVDKTNASLRVTCADPLSALIDRLLGKAPNGYKPTNLPRGQIVLDILAAALAEGNTLLRPGVVQLGANTTAGPWFYKPVLETIAELAATIDGFDYQVRPVEPAFDAYGLYIGLIDVVAAQGAWRPDAIFEHGTGRHNVSAYSFKRTKQGMLNRAYALPPGFPDNTQGAAVVSASDTASINQRRLREGVIAQDLTDQGLRQQLVDRHVAVRKRPRELVTITPFPTGYQRNGKPVQVPRFKVDYDVGDTLPVRLVKYGRVRLNAAARLYGADVTVNKNGVATITPQLQPA